MGANAMLDLRSKEKNAVYAVCIENGESESGLCLFSVTSLIKNLRERFREGGP